MKQTVGGWAFLIGLIVAVILGALGYTGNNIVAIILLALGVLVGLLNIADRETQPFLLAGTVLVVVSSLGTGSIQNIEGLDWLVNIFNALMLLFTPATIVVALKSVFTLAKE